MAATNIEAKLPVPQIPQQPPRTKDLATIPGPPNDQHVLVQSEGGRLAIDRDVVSKIIGLAVREVPGVHALAPHGASDRLANLADKITGSDTRAMGVTAELGSIECAADVFIIADYGADMPAVAKSIRQKVNERVQRMTGLKVRELNVEVVDLFFADTKTNARNLR